MGKDKSVAESMFMLFSGLDRAYGCYDIHGRSAKGKVAGRALTKTGKLTAEHWEKHLAGEQGLGVIPIMDDGKCWWACIDIDDYTLDINKLEQATKKAKLPVVVCRTKSGGAHVFVLFKEPAVAEDVRLALADWAAYLGYGGCEIFPKQSVLANKNDVGNWLNMPYFDAEATTRYIVRNGNPVLDVADAVDIFRKARINPADLLDVELETNPTVQEKHKGIPPCLEMLMTKGFPKGTRNEALFSLGVYCKQRWPDTWDTELEKINHEYMHPPLTSAEVQTVIKSLSKSKEYFYRCSNPPLAQVCNKPKCHTRAYGVGSSGASVEISALTKLCTEPPIWTVQVNGRRIQVDTVELLNQEKFRFKCFETMNLLPKRVGRAAWEAIINELTQTMQVIDDVPQEVSKTGQMLGYIAEFVASCVRTTDKNELVSAQKKLYVETLGRENWGWFRTSQLFTFLERKRYNILPNRMIYHILKERLSCKHKAHNIKKQCVNCWAVPLDDDGNLIIKE